MNVAATQVTLNVAMQARALYSLPDAADVRIQCEEGSVWVTQDDDPRDVVLEPGEAYIGSAHRRVLISALTASRLSVSPSHG